MPKSPDGDPGLHDIQMSLNGIIFRNHGRHAIPSSFQIFNLLDKAFLIRGGGVTQGWPGTPSLVVNYFIKSNIKLP